MVVQKSIWLLIFQMIFLRSDVKMFEMIKQINWETEVMQ